MPDRVPESQLRGVHPLHNLLPAYGISLLAGAPGLGKTALAADIIRRLGLGQPVFGHQPADIPCVGVVNADRGWATGAGEWFRRLGFPVRYYSMADDPEFDPHALRRKYARTQVLVDFIDRLKMPAESVVLVDPIGLFLGGQLLDYDTCAVACYELRRAIRQRALTLICTAHSSKLKTDKKERYLRLQDQILGSTALFGFTDSQMYLASPAETGKPYYTFVWHSHLAPAEVHTLERDEQGLFVPYSGADEGNCARVLALFPEPNVEVPLGALIELAEALPLSRATLIRVLDTLIDREKVLRPRRGMYLRLMVH